MTIMVIISYVMLKCSVSEILNRWPDRAAVFEDARRADPKLKIVAVHRWYQRGSIASKYWAALIAGSDQRRLDVTADMLMHAHAANKPDRSAAVDEGDIRDIGLTQTGAAT